MLMDTTRTLRTVAALLLAATFAPAAAVPAAAAAETCDGKVATIVVPPSPDGFRTDPVTGTPGDDVIIGTTWPDTIDGAGGADTICGLAGDDHLVGGSGHDRLFGGLDGDYEPGEGYDGDVIEPGPGNDYVDLGHDPQGQDLWELDPYPRWDRVSYRHSAGPVEVDLVAGRAIGEGTDTIAPVAHAAGIEGSAVDDVLLGSRGPDWIAAGGGDDLIDARGGHDKVMADDRDLGTGEFAGPGDDVVLGGPGSDNISGGGGSDRVFGGTGVDSIYLGSSAGAKGFGGDGRDLLDAGGRARVAGGRGTDWFSIEIRSLSDRVRAAGGAGSDSIDLSLAVPIDDRLVVGDPAGTMRVRGGPALVRYASLDGFHLVSDLTYDVTWYGTAGDDELHLLSLDGSARAFGRGGDDWLRGGQGDDHLDGGPGRDRLEGWSGDDVCLRGERLRSCEITH
jgi:Ca2+-binding RTX toxin-like protein